MIDQQRPTLTEQLQQARAEAELARLRIEAKALQRIEESQSLLDNYIDPMDAHLGPDGRRWLDISNDTAGESFTGLIKTEDDLARARQTARYLAKYDPHAISILENSISFVVGTGIKYAASPVDPEDNDHRAAADLADAWLKAWFEKVGWWNRQVTARRREDRDGEVFIRLFPDDADGMANLRYVEPGQVKRPEGRQEAHYSWGIETKPGDVEDVRRYWVDGLPVDAGLIQHRKNTDEGEKRGFPMLYALEPFLQRVHTTRKNMSIVFAAQAAIAAVRKSRKSAVELEQMINSQASYTSTDASGRQTSFSSLKPGTIWDLDADTEVEFPTAKVDVDGGNKIVQSELRAVGVANAMAEFMISGDASNGNYSSILVAESPGIRRFGRLQVKQMKEDVDLIWRAIGFAIERGDLPSNLAEMINIEGNPPSLEVRNGKEDAERFQIEKTNGVLSVSTWRAKVGYDNDTEEANIQAEREAAPEFANPLALPQLSGGSQSGDGSGIRSAAGRDPGTTGSGGGDRPSDPGGDSSA